MVHIQKKKNIKKVKNKYWRVYQTHVFCIGRWILYKWAQNKVEKTIYLKSKKSSLVDQTVKNLLVMQDI